MVDWFRFVKKPFSDDRRDSIKLADGTVLRRVGKLSIPSGSIVLGEIQWPPDLAVSNIQTALADVSVKTWQDQVAALVLTLGPSHGVDARRVVGQIGIDSAKMLVADKEAVAEHWADVGPDRIGVVSSRVELQLKKRFNLKTRCVNPIRTEIVGPVSEALEKEIVAYLPTIDPKYESLHCVVFYVQTNNTFERANFLVDDWAFLPIGNRPKPEMFVCTTGMGDGSYDVVVDYEGNVPRAVTVTFISLGDDERSG
jgi:hypothetical protein